MKIKILRNFLVFFSVLFFGLWLFSSQTQGIVKINLRASQPPKTSCPSVCPVYSPPVNFCVGGSITIVKDKCGCDSGFKCNYRKSR